MKQHADDKLVQNIRAALDRQADSLDANIQTRLDAVRRRTIQHAEGLQEEDPLLAAVRQQLDASARSLDPTIQQKLQHLRRQALSQTTAPLSVRLFNRLHDTLTDYRLALPAGAFATACVLITAVSIFYRGPDGIEPLEFSEELTLLASADDLELYENLDFYLWLADNGIPN